MEWLSDPTIWLGLATLVTLEIVLGIDNLIFISILAEKLPPEQRNKARLIGLSLALGMRLILLAVIAWLVGLTEPWFSVFDWEFSARDVILIGGGLFLLAKATMELHERLEGQQHSAGKNVAYASFGAVITQIVVLDAVFSLDAIITAVGMVDELGVMYAAVIIAMAVMIAASGPLMRFVNQHPTVVMLCLGFLLMIGASLIADGFGFHIPKGYLYAAIGFSILIEAFNQVSWRNRRRSEQHRPLRERTAEAVLRLLSSRHGHDSGETAVATDGSVSSLSTSGFAPEESEMVTGVLTLAERPVETIMTPRREIAWVDLREPHDVLLEELRGVRHGNVLVSDSELDQIVGVARTAELISMIKAGEDLTDTDAVRPPLYVPGAANVLSLLRKFRETRAQLAVVTDEFGSVDGVVTPVDVLEAIAGQLPDAAHGDEDVLLQRDGDGWIADGRIELFRLRQAIDPAVGAGAEADYISLAAFVLDRLGDMPAVGTVLRQADFEYTVMSIKDRRIGRVRIAAAPEPSSND